MVYRMFEIYKRIQMSFMYGTNVDFYFRKQLFTECRVLEIIDIAVVTVSFVVDVTFLIVAEGTSCANNYSK